MNDLEKKWWLIGYEDRVKRELASGSRLQAIADAWAETREMGVRFYMDDKLAALLDALTEEES